MASKIPILTLSLAQHLHGTNIQDTIDKAFVTSPAPELATTLQRFENIGFNISIQNPEYNIAALKEILGQRKWGGVIFGWCIRGSDKEYTELYEEMMEICVGYVVAAEVNELNTGKVAEPRTKLIFSRGPDDLVNAILRNFPA